MPSLSPVLSTPRAMPTTFRERDEWHAAWMRVMVPLLERYGCQVCESGQERLFDKQFHMAVVECGRADPTAQLMRYLPDLAVVTPRRQAWYCELKACKREADGRYTFQRTGNFSYEQDSLRVHQMLADDLGIRVMVAFHPGVACYADEIAWRQRFDDPQDANGSKEPFFTFPCTAPYLRPITDFLRMELR